MEASEKLLSAYIHHGHSRVQGWLSKGAISLISAVGEIQSRMRLKGHVSEIGVHHGKLFVLLYLMLRKSEKAVAVDIFENAELNVDASGKGNKSVFLRNVKRFSGDTSRLKIIHQSSTQISHKDIIESVGGTVRLFSVDGGHTAEITYYDLMTANNSLCEGGVIILDDYFSESWPEVSEGTNKFFYTNKNNRLTPFLIGGNKLLFTTGRSYARRYIDALQNYKLGESHKLSRLFGEPVLCADFTPPTLRKRFEQTWLWKYLRKRQAGKLIKTLVYRM